MAKFILLLQPLLLLQKILKSFGNIIIMSLDVKEYDFMFNYALIFAFVTASLVYGHVFRRCALYVSINNHNLGTSTFFTLHFWPLNKFQAPDADMKVVICGPICWGWHCESLREAILSRQRPIFIFTEEKLTIMPSAQRCFRIEQYLRKISWLHVSNFSWQFIEE